MQVNFILLNLKKMTRERPFVTVLMSCYNGEKWLSSSINSILNQTYRDFEFLLIDDGSSDRSLEIMREFEERDSRIRVITKENSGLPDSLNLGLQEARGLWIARLDADDLALPERLEAQYEIAKKETDLVLIGSSFKEMNETGDIGTIQTYPGSDKKLKKHLLTKKRFFAHSSSFYLKEAAIDAGSYRPRVKKSEDYDLWLRISELGLMTCLPEPLICFRTHPDQISLEDSGRRQIADGRIALVSYWIRKQGGVDPVDGDESDYREFREWMLDQIEASGIYKRREAVAQFKQLLSASGQKETMSGSNRMEWLKENFPDLLKGVKQHFTGEKGWKKVAEKWLDRQATIDSSR